ncbi:hypothetical protein [Motilimonas eburnea]|uniref:hypothetical protein n=1 Tax=Motilimonas eburnea TaxID=1737488 RepID=UPI001E4A9D75|nr:hypothetical protein [Motilimonas eburnea]MCE2571662.1 hypothetical protein [Motilimonas eburnea]
MPASIRDQALCLFLFNLKHTTECERYFDIELSVEVENAAFKRTEKLLGIVDGDFDFDDQAYLLKATDAERYAYMIHKIQSRFPCKTYLVVWENPFFGGLDSFNGGIDSVI